MLRIKSIIPPQILYKEIILPYNHKIYTLDGVELKYVGERYD